MFEKSKIRIKSKKQKTDEQQASYVLTFEDDRYEEAFIKT